MASRLRAFLFGSPKDVRDPHALHKLSLVAFLAWVGLGADGLSSSAYGPDESFRALGAHTGIAVFLALATAFTVLLISYGYSKIIEQFPSGGGGYVVASKLLGPRVGVVSGSALLVDYVLTVAISIASGAEAIFSFLPASLQPLKLPFMFFGLALLTLLNLRGVKESVAAIIPVFVLFLVTHTVLLTVVAFGQLPTLGATAHAVHHDLGKSAAALGTAGVLHLFVRAYSLGGGTYTGIEAVSNGVAMMREPRVRTAQRTMVLMAVSLAVTAAGIMLSYMLFHAAPQPGKTLNAVLLEKVAGGWPHGRAFVVVTLASEGALLFVAAQAGFLDGPRVMASMAIDSWLPRRFAALSDRLSMQNGILWMAAAGALALVYTRGDVSKLAVMYSINVFLTFTLSNLGMVRFWSSHRQRGWIRALSAHLAATALCVVILIITVHEKLLEGGWITLVVTGGVVAVCFAIKQHYARVGQRVAELDSALPSPEEVERDRERDVEYESHPAGFSLHRGALDRQAPTAIVFVGGYGGLGRHALLSLLRMFPRHFQSVVFVAIAAVDAEAFKGTEQLAALERSTREHLLAYERFARHLGVEAASTYSVGTEVALEAERIALALSNEHPRALAFAGQLLFAQDSLITRLLHNHTAFSIQDRLQRAGVPMVVLPVRIGAPIAASPSPACAPAG